MLPLSLAHQHAVSLFASGSIILSSTKWGLVEKHINIFYDYHFSDQAFKTVAVVGSSVIIQITMTE